MDDGGQVRCFAHVREVVDAVTRLMETPKAVGRVFNVGSDQPISIRELALEVISRVDRQVQRAGKAVQLFGRRPDLAELNRTHDGLADAGRLIQVKPETTCDCGGRLRGAARKPSSPRPDVMRRIVFARGPGWKSGENPSGSSAMNPAR